MGVSILALKFLHFVLNQLPDLDFSGIPKVANVSEVMNIFAWINFFIPSGVIISLLTLTAAFYVFRGIYVIFRDFIL